MLKELYITQDTNSFAKGKSLFQGGLLSEAVLALEAEVQRQPQNVEAWRLLGTVHAENDDDQQVIYLQPLVLYDHPAVLGLPQIIICHQAPL